MNKINYEYKKSSSHYFDFPDNIASIDIIYPMTQEEIDELIAECDPINE